MFLRLICLLWSPLFHEYEAAPTAPGSALWSNSRASGSSCRLRRKEAWILSPAASVSFVTSQLVEFVQVTGPVTEPVSSSGPVSENWGKVLSSKCKVVWAGDTGNWISNVHKHADMQIIIRENGHV